MVSSTCWKKTCRESTGILNAPVNAYLIWLYNMKQVFFFFHARKGRPSAQKKGSCGSPLVSISEREESYCGDATETDGAECTRNSPNSVAVSVEVHRINTGFMDLLETMLWNEMCLSPSLLWGPDFCHCWHVQRVYMRPCPCPWHHFSLSTGVWCQTAG